MLTMKGWVSDPAQMIFKQGNVDLEALNTGKSDDTLRQAFDEPLTNDQVLAIAKPFLGNEQKNSNREAGKPAG